MPAVPGFRLVFSGVSSVTTEAQLIALIHEAYGDGGLGLHRGHQPVEDVLNEVLTISHDELHVRMNQGQNLAASDRLAGRVYLPRQLGRQTRDTHLQRRRELTRGSKQDVGSMTP
jgi:hypothetical protein